MLLLLYLQTGDGNAGVERKMQVWVKTAGTDGIPDVDLHVFEIKTLSLL